MATLNYKEDGTPKKVEFLSSIAEDLGRMDAINRAAMGRRFKNGDEENEYIQKQADEYFDKLEKESEMIDFTDDQAVKQMESFKPEQFRMWLVSNGPSPFALAKQTDDQKWLNVAGNDENGNPLFFGMSTEELQKDALDKGLRWYDPEDRQKYFDKIKKLNGEVTRAGIAKEATEGVMGKATSIVLPGLMKVAQDAIMNPDKDITKGDLAKAAALDVAANGAMIAAPSLAPFRSAPIANSALDAFIQGAAEGVRQGVSDKIAGNEANLGDAVSSAGISAGTGFTAPAVLGSAAGLLGMVPGMGRFQQGLMRSFKAANPVNQERKAVVSAVKNADKMAKGEIGKMPAGPASLELEANANKGKVLGELLESGTDAKKAGRAYDALASGKGKMNPGKTINELTEADRAEIAKYMENFQAASNELKSDKDLLKKMGSILADEGGRYEPVIQGLPWKGSQRPTEYKEQPWYKKMDKKQRLLLDTAFKKKKEESEE